ncbi:MAG: arginine deiminase family protein [Saprospiraceae bacterium]|jgi:N-dimethylarginine dimethylaminohydrolase|nr:arginine deiminase family protein [Saprospiraceae bacterium]MDP4811326.1 arginine deiminase family protein [Saprospiraceae bacterium]MDP4815090.1 arginine deiminase family protein [Saprospiraceae bacterium]MDP5049198.1 arginine deiminase family protein [Saprospiraceae bacterium]
MRETCHSEYGKIKSILLHPAKNSFVSDANIQEQWQMLNYLSAPDYPLALKEYDYFQRLLEQTGSTIFTLPTSEKTNIDAIYCRDTSLATDFGLIIGNMGKAARKNENIEVALAAKSLGLDILGEIKHPGTLEGGDVAWIDEKTLAVGHSYRTNEEGIRQLKAFLNPKGIEVLVFSLPHYKGQDDVFHLMSIFSPVNKFVAVVYSPLMPISLRNTLLERGFNLVEVPEEEWESMGCNVLAIAPGKCLLVEGNPITKERLEKAGCEVIAFPGKAICLPGGGGPTCLTRPLFREI